MLRTPLLQLLDIEHPIIQAGMGRLGSGAALAAAVSNAGAIGTIGAAKRSPEELRAELQALRSLTSRPFIVNFTKPWLQLHPECLDCALAAGPRAISVAQGLPGEFVSRIHDGGALVITQVQTVEQARLAADEGADIIIAQGAEAGGLGGFGGRIGGWSWCPAVVDALSPLPVVACWRHHGRTRVGRGAALRARPVPNIGTRFLASVEASARRGLEAAPRGDAGGRDRPLRRLGSRRAGRRPGQGSPSTRPSHPARAWAPSPSVETAADIVLGLVQVAEQALARASALVVETPPLVGEGVSLRA